MMLAVVCGMVDWVIEASAYVYNGKIPSGQDRRERSYWTILLCLCRLAGSRSQHRLSVGIQLSSVAMPGGSSMRVTRHWRVLQFSI